VRRASELPGARTAGHEAPDLTWQLIQEVRRIPRELQPEALAALNRSQQE
jgi:hypothetical protein